MRLKRIIKDISLCDISVFIIIYFSHNTLLFGTNDNALFALIHYAIIALFFIYLWFTKTTQFIFIGKNIVTILTILSLLCMFCNLDFSLKYPFEILSLWIALLIVSRFSLNDFVRSSVRVLAFFSIISLIVYGISFLNFGLISTFPSVNYISGKQFYTVFGLCNIMHSYEYVFTRNFSIFREPGVYTIYLIVALLFILKLGDFKYKKIIIASFVVAILTTFSTAGYIILIMIFVYYFLSRKKESFISILLMFVIGLGVIYYVSTSDFIHVLVFDKMSGDNSSYNARLGSISTNIEMWLNNLGSIIFGNGFNYVETNYTRTSLNLGIYSTDNTNTLLKVLSVHGIIYFIAYLTMVIKTVGIFDKRIMARIILLFVFGAMLSNEDMIFDQYLYVLLLYGYVYGSSQFEVKM